MSHHHPGPASVHGHGAAPGHGAHDHGAAHTPEHDDEALTELLDLDGEVLHAYLDQATAWIAATAQPPVARVIDLGAGTGTGTFALLRRFPDAHVTAIDLDPRRLERIQARARDLDLATRVTTLATDLDQPWPSQGPAASPQPRAGLAAEPGLGSADLVWASMALHHVADPARTLTQVLGLLRPGGALVVAETSALESFPRFLPADVSVAGEAPGLEDRVHHLLANLLAAEVPELGADWASRLTAAGFEVAADQAFHVALDPPLPAQTGRYAQLTLDRLRTGLGDRLTPADQDALATLVASEGPASVLHRPDLTVRATRLAWLARRP
jgi:SAM-dependent methyltransferase